MNVFFRTTVAMLAATTLFCTAGCGSPAAKGPASAPAGLLDNIAAFRAKPSDATWEPVHNGLIGSAASQDSQSSLINALTKAEIPRKYVEAAAVDLAASDYQGSVRWIRLINIAARTDPSPSGQQTVRRSAALAWLMLALRTSNDTNGVDLAHMDLRSSESFVGQDANFDNVDFSQSTLSGGLWHYINLTDARFDGTLTTGPLSCTNCFWGRQQFYGTMVLQKGVWTAP